MDTAVVVHTISLVVFGSALLVLAFIDARTLRLPDILTLPLLWLGLLLCASGWSAISATQAIWGAALGYILLWLPGRIFLYVACRHAIGHGDAKLLAVIGAWLGADALPPVLIGASAAGLIFILARKQMQRSSNRINQQWRLCFEWPSGQSGPSSVEIVDYH